MHAFRRLDLRDVGVELLCDFRISMSNMFLDRLPVSRILGQVNFHGHVATFVTCCADQLSATCNQSLRLFAQMSDCGVPPKYAPREQVRIFAVAWRSQQG